MNKFAQLVREIVDSYLDEKKNQGRLPKGLGIDTEKASKIKQLYPKDHIIYKIVDAIENSEDKIITRVGYKNPSTGEFIDGLMQMFGLKTPQEINAHMSELVKSGIITDKDTAIPKKEKPESTGQRGRKASDTSKEGKIRLLHQKFLDNTKYEPSEEDITYNLPKGLGTEKLSTKDIEKTRNSAAGIKAQRGRPKTKTDDDLSGVKAAMKESLSEQFLRMHKLAGLL